MRQFILFLITFCLLPMLIFGMSPKMSQAIARLEEKAAAGDAEARYHLATLYEKGYDSIPANEEKALRLLKQSAEGGYAPAQNYLGFLFFEGNKLTHSKDSAIYWLTKAAMQHDIKAANNLGFIILNDTNGNRNENVATAARWFRIAADGGSATAAAQLADLYRTGEGVTTDTITAVNLYLQATNAGLRDAELKLLAMMEKKYSLLSPAEALAIGIEAAKAKAPFVAFRLYQCAAIGGCAKAFTLLGDAYSSAKGTDYDNEKSTHYFLLGAVKGDPSAQFIIAEMLEIFPDKLNSYAKEPDVLQAAIDPADFSSTQYWYSRAAQAGITDAAQAAARLFE